MNRNGLTFLDIMILAFIVLTFIGIWTTNRIAITLMAIMAACIMINLYMERQPQNASYRGALIATRTSKEDPHVKGATFEDYVLTLFPEEYFSIVHRTPTKEDLNGRIAENCENPDLKLRDRKTGKQFWIECKYRSRTNPDQSLEWCTEGQQARYKDIRKNTDTKTYIMIGLGGISTEPRKLFCFDLDYVPFNILFKKKYETMEIQKRPYESLRDFQNSVYRRNG